MTESLSITLAGSAGIPVGVAQHWLWCIEQAHLLVVADDEELVERICEALDRHQFEGIRIAAQMVGGGKLRTWDALSARTKRLRHNQFIDAALAVAAALRSTPPADAAAAGIPKDSAG